ncbi:MAG: hypothetical protein AAFQ96_06980 [Pseudomonadota bacterium]
MATIHCLTATIRSERQRSRRAGASRPRAKRARVTTPASIYPGALVLLGAGFFLLLQTGGVTAQSLKSIRAQQAEESALNSEVAYTNSVCGTSISASIDWSSAGSWPADESLAAACDGALGAVEAVCRASGGKARAARLTRFVCKGDGSGADLSGGELRYGASPGGNGFSETKTLLDSAL